MTHNIPFIEKKPRKVYNSATGRYGYVVVDTPAIQDPNMGAIET